MRKNRLLSLFAFLVFAFLISPLLIIAVTAFNEAPTITFPIQGFTFKWFLNVFETKSFMSGFALSFRLSITATLLALLVGVPAAYALSRTSMKSKKFLKSYFLSPTIIPGIVLGYALYQFIVLTIKLPVQEGLLIGHFLVVLPYIIRVVGSSLEQFDFAVEEAAWTLGCGKIKAFFKVVLPNISSGIVASFMLAFINSFNNIPVSMFLSGPGIRTLPTALMNYIEYYYDPTVSAISVLLMAGTLAIMIFVEKTLGIGALTN